MKWPIFIYFCPTKMTISYSSTRYLRKRLVNKFSNPWVIVLYGFNFNVNCVSQTSGSYTVNIKDCWEAVLRGGGIGWGDHFLPYKFIKRTFKHWVNSTKQLLNTGRGHQAPRKAAHYLQKEVGKNIKDKKRDKRDRDRVPSQEWSLKKRGFQTPGNTHTAESVVSLGSTEGNITGRENK